MITISENDEEGCRVASTEEAANSQNAERSKRCLPLKRVVVTTTTLTAPKTVLREPPMKRPRPTTTATTTATTMMAAPSAPPDKTKQDSFLEGLSVMYPRKAVHTRRLLRQGKPLQYSYSCRHQHRHGKNAVVQQQQQQQQQRKTLGKRAIHDYAEDLDRILYTISNGNAENAAHVLQALVRRSNLAPVTEQAILTSEEDDPKMLSTTLHSRNNNNNSTETTTTTDGNQHGCGGKAPSSSHCCRPQDIDRIMAQGVEDFVRRHNRGRGGRRRRRPKHEQDAVDAVLTAACSAYNRKGDDHGGNPTNTSTNTPNNKAEQALAQALAQEPNVPLDEIAARFRMPVQTLRCYVSRSNNQQQQQQQQHVGPPKSVNHTRDEWWYREEAAACVRQFCHSDESSWPLPATTRTATPPPAYAVRQVSNPTTGEQEPHPLRIWREPTMTQRYAVFCQSAVYRNFLLAQHQHQHHQHQHHQHQQSTDESDDRVEDDDIDSNSDSDSSNRKKPHKTVKTIGKSVFQMCLCPCVVNQHPKGKDRQPRVKPVPVDDGNRT